MLSDIRPSASFDFRRRRPKERRLKFLLVEDEPEIAALLQRMLHREKYTVDVAPDLSHAKEALRSADYPLVIADRRLPDGDGLELVEFARLHRIASRFLILSALSGVDDRVEGLDIGADDYIAKPFEPDELMARIRAALRRPLPDNPMTLSYGAVELDQKSRAITIGGKNVAFSRRELSIVEVLMQSAGRVVTRDLIEAAVYGYDDEIQSNTLESHISRIRKTLAQEQAGLAIHAVRGVGYMLKEQ